MDDQDILFFEKALEEEGLTDAEVLEYRDQNRMSNIIKVKKVVNGETYQTEQRISDREWMQVNDKRQYMATLAGRVARKFEECLTEKHEWGQNRVLFDLKREQSVECLHCGAEVSMSDLDNFRRVSMAESSVPKPSRSKHKTLSSLKTRITLLALLKRECEHFCTNSPKGLSGWSPLDKTRSGRG